MEDEKFNFVIDKDSGEIIIRHGEAAKIPSVSTYNFTGDLNAPYRFVKSKLEVQPEGNWIQNSVVEVDFEKFTVTYRHNPQQKDCGYVITGKLCLNPDLEKFKINTDSAFTFPDLMKFLRRNRRFFHSPDEYNHWVKKLLNFKAKVTQIIDSKDDLKGNQSVHYDQIVEQELPDHLTLKIPIFKNMQPDILQVSIYIPKDNVLSFYFESLDLYDIIEEQAHRYIDGQITQFNELQIPVLVS